MSPEYKRLDGSEGGGTKNSPEIPRSFFFQELDQIAVRVPAANGVDGGTIAVGKDFD